MISSESFLDIGDLLPEPMFLVDQDANIIASNTAALEVLEHPIHKQLNCSFHDVISDNEEKINDYLLSCTKTANLVLGAVELVSRTGRKIAARIEGCLASYDPSNQEVMVLLRCVDKRKSNARFLALHERLSERTHDRTTMYHSNYDMHELQQLALLDELTGLPNRRSLDKNLDYEWKRTAREYKPMSAILIDIDCFKAFNDNYGHLAGDACIKEVAQTVQYTSQRPADLTARYGGEEFAVLLPSTQSEGAYIVAERIRQEIEKLGILHKASGVSEVVTASLGVATLVPSLDLSPLIILAQADNALYQAKKQGRNKVSVYDADSDFEASTRFDPMSVGNIAPLARRKAVS